MNRGAFLVLSRATSATLSVWLGAALVVGCGGDGSPRGDDAGATSRDAGSAQVDAFVPIGMDGGSLPDAGPRPEDAGSHDARVSRTLPTCAAPVTVMGTIGLVSVPFDTKLGPVGPLDLSDECLAPEAVRPPQYIIDYLVPGTGGEEVTLEFTTDNDATSGTFDTLVEVRDACTETPSTPGHCFDGFFAPHAAGIYTSHAGSHVFFVVTGFRSTLDSEGEGRLDIRARVNSPPILSSATAASRGTGEDAALDIIFYGSDVDGDVVGFTPLEVAYVNDAHEILDTNGDGTVDADDVTRPNTMMFTERRTTFRSWLTDDLFGFVSPRPTQVRMQLIDRAGARSGILYVPIVQSAALGAPCDETHVCRVTNDCDASTHRCELPTALRNGCAAPTPIEFRPVTGPMSTQVDVAVDVEGVESTTHGSCGGNGPERVFSITTPAGAPPRPYDVLVTATAAPSAPYDPVLYVRTSCLTEPPASEAVCNDDIGAGRTAQIAFTPSPATTYFLFFDLKNLVWGPTTPVHFTTRYRPILATGTACDPAERDNRCTTGHCPMAGTAVCP